MRMALAQINSVVGDIDGNAARVVEWIGPARQANPQHDHITNNILTP